MEKRTEFGKIEIYSRSEEWFALTIYFTGMRHQTIKDGEEAGRIGSHQSLMPTIYLHLRSSRARAE